MASINSKTVVPAPRTAGGAVAARIAPLQELIRLTMSCMLWEDNFYSDGKSVAERIKELVHSVALAEAAGVAIEAREKMKLRHVPLLIVREMARNPQRGNLTKLVGIHGEALRNVNHPAIIADTIARVVQRPDELAEFLAIYWKDGKQPLSKQVKLGLARAFQKFDEYALAKYNRDKDIKLRDVLFLCHSKPKDVPAGAVPWDKDMRDRYAKACLVDKASADDDLRCVIRPQGFSEGELLYGKLVYDQLATPDTWEVELSKGGDKSVAWTRLLLEKKLGDLAFLRNLRNMLEAGISTFSLAAYGDERRWGRVLPFRFVSAARQVPQLEPQLERWMFKALEGAEKLSGSTLLVVDVSGSMFGRLSAKSELRRIDVAAALTALARELCEDATIYTTAGDDYKRLHATALIPARRGMALIDYVSAGEANARLGGGGIFLTQCLEYINTEQRGRQFDRVIVFTDEQDCDRKLRPEEAKLLGRNNYMINIAAERNGIGYKRWLHIDGFSEAVLDYIAAYERFDAQQKMMEAA